MEFHTKTVWLALLAVLTAAGSCPAVAAPASAAPVTVEPHSEWAEAVLYFASAILLTSIAGRFAWLRRYGAALSLAIITGAIVFHLFTPLGVVAWDMSSS